MKSEITKSAILDSAVKCLANSGLEASLRQIAKRAGVSPALVMHYFGSRDHLVHEAIQTSLSKLFQRKQLAAQSGSSDVFSGLFLDLSKVELTLLRRVLATDSQFANLVFDEALKIAVQHLGRPEGADDSKNFRRQASLLTAQALGSIVMLPQLERVLGRSGLVEAALKISGTSIRTGSEAKEKEK